MRRKKINMMMVLVFNSYDRITILFSLLIRIHHFQKILKKLKLKYVYICVCVCVTKITDRL